jgi:hypothetical protein
VVNESADPDYSYTQPPAPTHTHHDNEPIICFRLCGKPGHIAIGCRVRLDHSRQAYNFQQINAEDRTYAYQQQSTRETTGLLGSPNEVTMKVNGIAASALLDTGSTVSTVSESFYLQYLANQPIQTLNHILLTPKHCFTSSIATFSTLVPISKGTLLLYVLSGTTKSRQC